jgi:hypothetical protein
MKTEYSRWMESVMNERKADKISERVESILAIKALGLPYDLTKEMILSYKYDILEEKWKKHYRVVLFQIRSILVSKHERGCDMSSFSYWPNQSRRPSANRRPSYSRTSKPSRTSS